MTQLGDEPAFPSVCGACPNCHIGLVPPPCLTKREEFAKEMMGKLVLAYYTCKPTFDSFDRVAEDRQELVQDVLAAAAIKHTDALLAKLGEEG